MCTVPEVGDAQAGGGYDDFGVILLVCAGIDSDEGGGLRFYYFVEDRYVVRVRCTGTCVHVPGTGRV